MTANDPQRFILKIELYAAAAPIEFGQRDLTADHTGEMKRLVEQLSRANPDDIEDRICRTMRFDLCGECHGHFLQHPLGL